MVLLGGGGHCVSVLDAVIRQGIYKDIRILDRPSQIGKRVLQYTISGSDEELVELFREGYRDAFVTVGSIQDSSLRKKLAQRIREAGFHFINVIDPSATVAESVVMGTGIFVGKRAVINAGSEIGDMAIINTGAIVEHGNRVGAYAHVSVGAVLCGDVSVGVDCLIGANATILQGLTIGEQSIVGAGSLILKNVPPYSKVYGFS